MKLVLALALISLAAATTACSDGASSSRADGEATATETASAPPSATSRGARYRSVRFTAADGVYLVGRLWGSGDVGVILAHGFSHGPAQEGWLPVRPRHRQPGVHGPDLQLPGVLRQRGLLRPPWRPREELAGRDGRR